MGGLLRNTGSQTLVGVVGCAIGFLAIGLALGASDSTGRAWVVVSFVVALIFFLCFLIGTDYLIQETNRQHGYIGKLREFIRRGNALESQIVDTRVSPSNEIKAWEDEVLDWLHVNLLDYVPDFSVNRGNYSLRHDRLSDQANYEAIFVNSHVTSLLEILRDVRAAV